MSEITVGQAIAEARKKKGMKQDDLAAQVGVHPSSISQYESDYPRKGIDPDVLVKIATVLDCTGILTIYLENNPVYKAILPKIFPDLNNIRRDPTVIFYKVAKEAEEASDSAKFLGDLFGNVDPRKVPNFDEVFKANMEQIIDIKRAVEVMEFQLLASYVMSQETHLEIYARQQRKCESKGHHVPDRTGTEG